MIDFKNSSCHLRFLASLCNWTELDIPIGLPYRIFSRKEGEKRKKLIVDKSWSVKRIIYQKTELWEDKIHTLNFVQLRGEGVIWILTQITFPQCSRYQTGPAESDSVVSFQKNIWKSRPHEQIVNFQKLSIFLTLNWSWSSKWSTKIGRQ